jgi:hypothetical protein
MSEAEYTAFQRQRKMMKGAVANNVSISAGGNGAFTHEGTLDFIDNTIDRSSGTI